MTTAVIGLDGATFDIINPLITAGRMPVLARMMRDGSHAPLRSTILPNSFPGWASCTTGTSEGMHGVFSPFIKNPGSYSVRAMSGRDIMTRHVWDFLGHQDGRSLVLNVPTTYPPEPINGLMVTGMLTPSREVQFTHPASLKADLLAEIPGYIIEPERIPDKRARAVEFRQAIEMTGRALDFMLKQGDWDFLMVVFSVLDRAQHDYWADRDGSHPRHDPQSPAEFRGFIDEIYERLDEQVGRLLEKLPPQCRTFVVSDHGFCAELYEVRVNEALSQAGLLSFKAPVSRKSRAQLRSLKEKVSRRLIPARPAGNVLEKKVKYGSAFLDEIDWTRTRAFFAQDKGVWVNLADREPEGIVAQSSFETVVEEARQALSEIKGPDGSTVFESVTDRNEAFNGRWSERLPDLVMIPRRDEIVYNERPSYGGAVVPADSTTGTHSRDGILIAWGSGIETQAHFAQKPNLRDIGPTALASLGCPLSEDMDGRPLEEVFAGGVEVKRQGSSYRDESPPGDAVYSIGEEGQLRERLRGLGYIE